MKSKTFIFFVVCIMAALSMLMPLMASAAPSAGLLRGKAASESTASINSSLLTDGSDATSATISNGQYVEWVLDATYTITHVYFIEQTAVTGRLQLLDESGTVLYDRGRISSTGGTSYTAITAVNNVKKVRVAGVGGNATTFEVDVLGTAALDYSGGLLDGRTMNLGPEGDISNSTTLAATDNNESTVTSIGVTGGNDVLWYEFPTLKNITGFRIKSGTGLYVAAYGEGGTLISQRAVGTFNLNGNLVPFTVSNVKTIIVVNTLSTTVDVAEFNVYGSDAPDTTPPIAPTGLTATGQVGQILLDWADVSDAASYKVYRDGTQVASGVVASTWTDTGVADGVTYSYEVTAVDAAGNESPRSTAATAETAEVADEIPPATPTGVTTTPGDGQIHVTWDANTDDATGYNVYVNGVKGNTTPITTPSATLTGLNNGQTYQVQISAVDAAGNESPRSAPVAATPFGALVPPTNLRAIPKNAEVELKWDAVPGATGYRIYRDGTLIGSTTTETRYVDTTVTNDNMYVYRVTATGDEGVESGPSDPKSARPGNIIVIEPDAPLFGGLMGVLETGWSFLKKFGGYVAIVLAILFAPTIISFAVWLFRKLSPSKAAKKSEAGGKKQPKQRKQLTPEEKERRARERRLNKARDDKYDQLTRMGRISERDKWAREIKYMNREQREAKAREERNRKSREQRAASSGGGRTQRSGRSSRRGR